MNPKILALKRILKDKGISNPFISHIKYDPVYDDYRVFDSYRNFLFKITPDIYDEVVKEVSIQVHIEEQRERTGL